LKIINLLVFPINITGEDIANEDGSSSMQDILYTLDTIPCR